MARLQGQLPSTPEKFNVAVQRPNVNVKESENVGEQAKAEARRYSNEQFKFSKHGTFPNGPDEHPVNEMFQS